MQSLSHPAKHRPPHRRRPVFNSIRLTIGRKWGVYGVALGIWGSGVAWLVLHYFFRRKSDFGYETHPLESWSIKIHGAFAFGAIAMLGLLWGVHILNGWHGGRRRWSGGVLLGVSCFLVLSGYLLYYAGDDGLRDFVSIAHWSVGLAVVLVFFWHRFWPGQK